MHILMLLSNAFRPDPRVEREASALTELGHQVTVICWDREVELPRREQHKDTEIIRVHNVQSSYGSGWRQIFYTPRFWREAIRLALETRPNAVHCHDLDTLYAGWQIKKRLGCPLVYDAHENYPALMSLYLPDLFVWMLFRWERLLLKHVDVTITASTILRNEFRQLGISPVVTLGNFQPVNLYTSISKLQIDSLRSQLNVLSDKLLVAYIGGFSLNRVILPFIEAAKILPEVQFHIWGDGHQRQNVEQTAAHFPNVLYHGWLPFNELPKHFKAADVIYYCLRVDYPGAIYNAPNTLSQTMAAGRPIIANNVGDLGRIVKETQCGILIDQTTPEAIAAAIKTLENPETRRQLGSNGLKSAQNTYNVTYVQEELNRIYRELLGNKPHD